MKEMNLICLPFAGGNIYSYQDFAKLAPSFLKVIPVELPGRGTRIREKLLRDIDQMVNDIFNHVLPYLNDKPYMIYGHSMGTLLGYLLTKRILKEGLPAPKQLIFTGARAPSSRNSEEKRYLLPKDKFIAKLIEYGGSPDEILRDESVMEFFEPIIRADFEGVENYVHSASEPFDIPIYVMIGLDEPTTYEEALAWQNETNIPIEIKQFKGRHFFIYEHQKEIMSIIINKINKQFSNGLIK
jgi:surfactin synthase thioesterase subunit